MKEFVVALIAVSIMLIYAVPGYVTVKAKVIKPEAISAFAIILMYICSPCLTIYSITLAEFSWHLLIQMVIFFALSLALQCLMLISMYIILSKKSKINAKHRIYIVATAFGNCGFMGVPLLQALFPNQPQAVVLSACFLIAMNLLGWTVGSALIANDKKYLNWKKAIINPATVGLMIALPFFFTNSYSILPIQIQDMISLLAKMSTPMCMLILGMRLATMKATTIFSNKFKYVVVLIKQIAMPAIALLVVWWLPIDDIMKKTLFIMCATPIASVVLNFSEMYGQGQQTAATLVLLGTIMSVATIPIMMLLI